MMKTQSEPKQGSTSSRTITFRVNSDTLAKLRDHAAHEKLTLNALVNRLLLQTVKWNITASKSDWVPAERGVVMAILESLDDESIIQIAKKQGKSLPRDICLSMRGNYGLKEWIDIINLWSTIAGFNLTTMHANGQSVFVLRHDMGKKHSLHIKSFYEQAFRGFGCDAAFEASENTLVFKIPDRSLSE